jgi:hypothetical protein
MNVLQDFNRIMQDSAKARAEYDFIYEGEANRTESSEYYNEYSQLVAIAENAEKHERRLPNENI